MKILCIDSPYAKAMELLGHTVVAPELPHRLMHLPGLIKHLGFEPDLLIQNERLGPRLIFSGLEHIKCPTVFVSIDAHLNMFWHKHYGRLFDVVCTPHISLYKALEKSERPRQLMRIGPRGYERSFKAFADRSHQLGFAGVLTKHRPGRKAMVDLLSRCCGIYLPEEYLAHTQMLDLFADSLIIPNESIALEVNYRIFEAASCGCVVLSQNIGEDQNAHFKPGVEFDTYDNALELVDKIKFYSTHASLAEKMGQAAWNRVKRQHLDIHRAGELLKTVGYAQARATGEEAGIYLWLALAQLSRNKMIPLSLEVFMGAGLKLEQHPLAAAMKINLLVESTRAECERYEAQDAEQNRQRVAEFLKIILRDNLYAGSPECNLAGAMASIVLEDFGSEKAFWLRQVSSICDADSRNKFESDIPKNAYESYLSWGKLMFHAGRYANRGFGFQVDNGVLPTSATDCLIMAQNFAGPQQNEWLDALHQVCQKVRGYSFLDMGFLAELSLRYPESWNYQLLYGSACLQNYRMEEGLHELAVAKTVALQSNESFAFNKALEALPGYGYILPALQ